ncbi:PIN domain-containing protein [Alterinioella nitratireducens]|uniref:PIN domain-containing protein n=1 Tax=Alterinioella nitratireducens TaxID=2735915 RepID=UPI001F1ADF42|nr:PIN domain-containing protein [Alterinioella nitratireducens]
MIDFENVQPKNLGLLRGHPFTLVVFVGASQKNVPFDFANALQDLGENASYRKITGNGSNALDFHIAFYLGQLAAKDDNGYFHIISRDKGFDPLISHLRERKIYALRHVDISEIPFVKISNASSLDQKVEAIVDSLRSRGTSRPRKVKTLKGTMNGLFMKTLDESDQDALVDELKKRGHVVVEDQSVSYGPAILGH